MSARMFIAWFDEEHAVLDATRAAREAGLKVHDVYTPYAVHGMDEAMGLRPSRLTWVCLGAGLFGLSFALWLQYYTSAVSWPLNVGGKPFASWPAFIPVTFELTVLCAALITVAALFVRAKLAPRLASTGVVERVTNDRFALVLVTADDHWSHGKAAALSAKFGAVETGYSEAVR